MVPQRAVQEVQGSHQVAVVGPTTRSQIRAVKVGPRYEQLWVITDGVKAGERVVAEGLQKVRGGVKVQAKPYVERPPRRQAGDADARLTRGPPAMSRFFINRPIVAMVIAILMTLIGIVSMLSLPIALYPNIAPPEIQLSATYPGADALTCEQAVAAPIEQQMSGVPGMIYMYSTNASNGSCTLRIDFDVTTDAYIDQVLSQMRYSQAESQLPQDVRAQGVTILQSTTSPLALFSVYSPEAAPTTRSSSRTTPTSTSTTR